MPYDKITVSAIADASGLSRQTFYYHFGSVFAIVRRLCLGRDGRNWKEDIAWTFRASSA
ncbi:MAG: TetR family transcriptional regulator [Candidatus Methanomethylophilus sp.]|jgi:AcrR family transcriptional regulator|nr:TetR family transcriptional regulator [Methanomethylophilus sp.]MCI2075231.1 TetR family transcriptional regulator [Methanomethylophilus sp.]MCI2092573.1 TetR family transcriptional regulator [Methanomethylophilus sp.]